MADFAAVLRKTIEALPDNNKEARERIYQRARNTIEAKIQAVTPPPPAAIVERQRRLLQDAIDAVELEFAPPPPPEASSADFELESVLRDLEALVAKPVAPSPAPPSVPAPVSQPIQPKPVAAPPVVTAPIVAPQLPEPVAEKEDEAEDLFEVPAKNTVKLEGKVETPVVDDMDVAEEAVSAAPPIEPPAMDPIAELMGMTSVRGAISPATSELESKAAPVAPVVKEAVQVAASTASTKSTKAETEIKEAAFEDSWFDEAPASAAPLTRKPEAKAANDAAPSGSPALSVDQDKSERPAVKALREKQGSRKRGLRKLLLLLLVLLILGGIAVAGWFYRDAIMSGLALDSEEWESSQPAGNNTAPVAAPEQPSTQPQGGQLSPGTEKLTQRLLPDGSEVDEGPAAGVPGLGEGTSMAASTEGAGELVSPQQPTDAVPATGTQRSLYYEERTIQEAASASEGTVAWSIEEESPEPGFPAEPAIVAEARIPERNMTLRMTIRRNLDDTLPASHIMELIFLTPEDFPGGGIANIASVSLKRTEQDTGSRLLAAPVKIADGFFLVALSDQKPDIESNLQLLERMDWIDIPVLYTSGRRALITLEKGASGMPIFTEALTAWRALDGQ